MLYRNDTTDFPFNDSSIGCDPESLLMRSRRLRYDRSHGGAAGQEAGTEPGKNRGEGQMDISGAGSVGGAGPVRPTDLRATPEVTPAPAGIEMPVDEVEISAAAQMLEKLSQDPQVRAARLAEIQSQIAAGTYDTPEKLEAAVARMLADLS